MPIKIEILRQGRLVLFTYPGTFTVDELTSMNDALQRDILSKATHTIYMIADVSALTRAPTNILTHSIGMMRKLSTNIGAIIVVTPNNTIKSFANIFFKLFPLHRFAICGTVAEALEQIDHLIALETQ